jgi:hypothetical protein
MHIQYRLLVSYLLLGLGSSPLVCMEPNNNVHQYADALSAESADELYIRVGQKILDAHENKQTEIYALATDLLHKAIEIGLATGRWDDADRTRAWRHINTFVSRKREPLEREFLAYQKVHKNFHRALITGNFRSVVGIQSIVNRVKYNAPFPIHPEQMYIADIGIELWPYIKRTSECLLVDYQEPLHNKLAFQKNQHPKK